MSAVPARGVWTAAACAAAAAPGSERTPRARRTSDWSRFQVAVIATPWAGLITCAEEPRAGRAPAVVGAGSSEAPTPARAGRDGTGATRMASVRPAEWAGQFSLLE